MELPLEIGAEVRRQSIHDLLGGQRYGGISTPRKAPHIFLFTDPTTGRKFGYDRFEGPTEEGGYNYTGAGQVGDQVFGGGNKSILQAADEGKTILLFRAHSPFATFIGEFFLGDPRFTYAQAPDKEGQSRQVIVFNLVPISGNPSLLAIPEKVEPAATDIQEWSPPDFDSYGTSAPNASTEDKTASRQEFELQAKFGEWLIRENRQPRKLTIRTEGVVLSPDLYDESMQEIIEAKKSPAREFIRTAIGQVLDYKHCAEREGDSDYSAAILVPGRPSGDMIELCLSLNIGIYFPTADGFQQIRDHPPKYGAE